MLYACASASAATVYKWVDDNGVTHFSDQPNPKAQKVEVPDAQTYGAKAAALAPPAAASAPAPTATPAVCMIDSPGPGQVFIDTFAVSGHVTLAHVDNSQPVLRLDGLDISGQLQPDGAFQLNQMERGDHTLSLEMNGGQVACKGNSVTFSIRQQSAGGANAVPMAPQAPAAPKAPGVGAGHH